MPNFLTNRLQVTETLNNLAVLHRITNNYDPALKIRRGLAEAEPRAFLPNLAKVLLNMSIFHLKDVPDKSKSIDYAQEARDILIPLCKQAPHLQGELDKAEQLLKLNNTKPNA
jgi:hypothetical protein